MYPPHSGRSPVNRERPPVTAEHIRGNISLLHWKAQVELWNERSLFRAVCQQGLAWHCSQKDIWAWCIYIYWENEQVEYIHEPLVKDFPFFNAAHTHDFVFFSQKPSHLISPSKDLQSQRTCRKKTFILLHLLNIEGTSKWRLNLWLTDLLPITQTQIHMLRARPAYKNNLNQQTKYTGSQNIIRQFLSFHLFYKVLGYFKTTKHSKLWVLLLSLVICWPWTCAFTKSLPLLQKDPKADLQESCYT